jgi:hypothetical protein
VSNMGGLIFFSLISNGTPLKEKKGLYLVHMRYTSRRTIKRTNKRCLSLFNGH